MSPHYYLFLTLYSLLVLPLTAGLLKRLKLWRENYRGEQVLTAFGLYFFLVLIPFLYFLFPLNWPWLLFLMAAAGTGLLDDLYGEGEHGGLRGHLSLLLEQGRLTTGSLKLIIISLAAIFPALESGLFFLLSWPLLLMSTNFINLLDLRPGRALKVFFLALFLLLITVGVPLFLLASLIPLLLYFEYDLRGEAMLGDTGSNLLGALLGLAFIQALSFWQQIVTLLALALIQIYAEASSLSALIERYPLLRLLDGWGRE